MAFLVRDSMNICGALSFEDGDLEQNMPPESQEQCNLCSGPSVLMSKRRIETCARLLHAESIAKGKILWGSLAGELKGG